MHFLKYAAFALLPSVLAAPVPAAELDTRDAASITNSITQIKSGLAALNTAVTNFKGGLNNLQQVLTVQRATSSLSKTLQSAIKTTKASQKLDDNGSLQVGLAVLDLQPNINTVLDNIVSKAPDFDKVAGIFSVRSTVLQSLTQQRDLSAQFGQAVTNKLTPTFAAIAPEINRQIADKFNSAIAVYKQKGSGIPLPAIPSF